MSKLSGHNKQIGFTATAFLLILIIAVYVIVNKRMGSSAAVFDEKNGEFTLQPGDILARPNLNWLPGSSKVPSGRKFGHASIIIRGASGKSPEEALQKAFVVEAVLFDQATRKFVFDEEKQVRLTPALISFDKRFSGIRYRLRMRLDPQQQQMLLLFLEAQTGKCRYKVFSNMPNCPEEKVQTDSRPAEDCGWNCATLVWYSLCHAAGINVDDNQGTFVYPNDIINSPLFNSSEGRLRF